MRTSHSDLILQKCPPCEGLKTQIGSEVKQNNCRHMLYAFFTFAPIFGDGWKGFVLNFSVVNEAKIPYSNDSKTPVATISAGFVPDVLICCSQ